MKRLVLALAGAAVGLALVAGPIAAQGRERPATGAGGGSAASGGGGARSDGGGSAGVRTGSSGSGGGYSSPAPSSGGSSTSSGTPYTGSSGGARVRGGGPNGGVGAGGYMRPGYGTPEDHAVPRGARPNPGVPSNGEASVRNPGQPSNTPGHRPGGGGGYDSPYYYPYYPYDSYYLYGYGAFGLGYLYYDPFWWGYGDYYGGGYGAYTREAPVGRGSLKLKVEPKSAEVYIDGYYMGTVDDFDGVFQKMALESGAHRVEIRAAGYQSITFDVRIEPNDTVTYRGELQPAAGIKR
jgi:hypothetical protein